MKAPAEAALAVIDRGVRRKRRRREQTRVCEPVQRVRGRGTQATQVTARTPWRKDHDFHLDWANGRIHPKEYCM